MSQSALQSWFQAARPLAQLNIALPLLVGQALAFATCGRFSWSRLLLVLIFGLLDHLFIVFANDSADWQGDVLNKSFNRYSGGSRVVPEGKLSPRSLAHAALLMVALMALLATYMTLRVHLLWMLVLCSFAVALLWAYSFPPLRLSYRGHGEVLQGLGLGVVLPAIGFYAQCGSLSLFPAAAFLPLFVLGYAGNILTSLPDVAADRAVGKRSFPVRRGQLAARRSCIAFIAVAVCSAPLVVGRVAPVLLGLLIAVPLLCVAASIPLLKSADATEPSACSSFMTRCGAAIVIAQLGWIVALFAHR